ncbi:Phosphoinositide phosphatase sac1 [Microsporum canis]|uniref:Recessive suppressor of secretory defect n=1 Tax=Arthroderma otae (strain ATCC MYA-4605 / CBS 113480) TaxID=554155 RepID=C5FSR6_ARTOC|nr:recessive suppressor of secretory defect [Microsporum canis CBS 113480]EEQ32919.1 recessive suppressor of secretory defect [Microsporum canis CBS 113480]
MSPNLPFRDINLYASPHCYAFRSASSSSAPSLVIERPTGDLRLENASTHNAKRVSSIAGILGIVKLKLDKYVIVITKEQPMGRLRGHMVYKVVATEFLPLRDAPLHDPDEDAYLALLKKLLATGPMYYSYSLDITNSFQRQSQSDPSLPLWKRADDRFFWNRFIQTDLIDFSSGLSENTGIRSGQSSDVDPYILPVMFGMMRITPAKVKSTPFTFALITRRSRFRAGTRYFSRGIDEHGNVSNYNETEQVAILNDATGGVSGFAGGPGMGDHKMGEKNHQELQVLSFVQTRGSIPVYWAEVNNLHYTPKLAVRGVDAAASAARMHFSDQIKTYGENYLVNLVNQKGREEKMKKAYEQLMRLLVSAPAESRESDLLSAEKMHTLESSSKHQEMDRLHYIYFDFHNETKGLQWHRAELLLNRLKEGLQRGQYFSGTESLGNPSGTLDVRTVQSSVVRTNCMDCLDRTNVVQSMLGRWTLTRQFIDCGILQPGEKTDDDLVFRDLFRNMWADNADVVSKSYSGTGALKTDFTRTGERTKAGALQDGNNSITRYILNNFMDGPRQDAYDLFHGTYLPSSTASYVFADRRPLIIQSIPYILGAAIFMILVAMFTRQLPDSTAWPLRIFLIFWIVVAAWCLRFIHSHGMLYVNWPKLNTPAAGAEGYAEALRRASNDKLIGDFIPSTKHQRGVSNARLGFMEEGKKRIE